MPYVVVRNYIQDFLRWCHRCPGRAPFISPLPLKTAEGHSPPINVSFSVLYPRFGRQERIRRQKTSEKPLAKWSAAGCPAIWSRPLALFFRFRSDQTMDHIGNGKPPDRGHYVLSRLHGIQAFVNGARMRPCSDRHKCGLPPASPRPVTSCPAGPKKAKGVRLLFHPRRFRFSVIVL